MKCRITYLISSAQHQTLHNKTQTDCVITSDVISSKLWSFSPIFPLEGTICNHRTITQVFSSIIVGCGGWLCRVGDKERSSTQSRSCAEHHCHSFPSYYRQRPLCGFCDENLIKTQFLVQMRGAMAERVSSPSCDIIAAHTTFLVT